MIRASSTAVRATIEAARDAGRSAGVGNSRTALQFHAPQKFFKRRFASIGLADRVALGGVFRAQQLGDENRLDPETVAASVRALSKRPMLFPGGEAWRISSP